MHRFFYIFLVFFVWHCIVLRYFLSKPTLAYNQIVYSPNSTQTNVTYHHQTFIPQNIIQTGVRLFNDLQPTRSFKEFNPHYSYFSYDDSQAKEFVHKHMPSEIIHAYDRMPKAILKADYFRYISIYVLGGVYSDHDTECLRPIDTWGDHYTNISFIAGVEAEGSVERLKIARPLQLCQWTFAAAPKHPMLKRMIDNIEKNTRKFLNRTLSISLIMEWTGPGLWTDTIFDYINETYHVPWHTLLKLEHGRLIGDIYILPITAFAPGALQLGAKGKYDREARVWHQFRGSWRHNLPER